MKWANSQKHKFVPKLTQKEMKILNRSVTGETVEPVSKTFQQRKKKTHDKG